jgi:hypothetical protein
VTAPKGNGFHYATGVNVYSTGEATIDRDWERDMNVRCVRVLHRHAALDLLPMLFGPLISTGTPKR